MMLPLAALTFSSALAQQPVISNKIKIANGTLEGVNESGIVAFKGVPYAAPPVGDLRWKEPHPATNWTGIRKADKFGPRAMQRPIFSDMNFRSDGVSEDCLYLNIWTPAKTAGDKLPVLVYFYGGGFVAGDGSEPRYAGESMARNGIVAITVNYRLGVFGFMAHPELTKESPHHASGNYGLLDQSAALKWVQQNIAAFGGDPKKITIAGESAGSFSVSAQMASPLSRNIIAGAIGESGSSLGKQSTVPLDKAEEIGVQFAKGIGASSLADLRSMSAEKVLEETAKPAYSRFPVCVDGYFFPKSPVQVYASGEQAKVPLLVGWNSAEGGYNSTLGKEAVTRENFDKAVKKIYGDQATEILKVYNPANEEEIIEASTDLMGDRFIGFSTWKWSDIQSQTGGKPVYRYMYALPRPATIADKDKNADASKMPRKGGASHSSEIEYAMGNLATNLVFDWQPEDYKVSQIMQGFFSNFIKTGNPNGLGVPAWPAVKSNGAAAVMHIDVETKVMTEKNRDRYLLLDKL